MFRAASAGRCAAPATATRCSTPPSPLDAAASAALSSSGSYGPQLLVDTADVLPQSVLNFFLDYATPGYTAEGPTAAVYNHGWVIGDPSTISVAVQAEMDSLLEVVPQK